MLTTSPVLTSDAKNASPRAFQFASSSPLHGSQGRPRSRSRKNSVASQSPMVAPALTPVWTTSVAMASPSEHMRSQNSAPGNSHPAANGPSNANPAKPAAVPTKPPHDSADIPVTQERPRQAQPSPSKLNSAKRSASSTIPMPDAAEAQNDAASGEPDRPAQRAKPLPAPPKTLPLAYETCNVGDMVALIAHMVQELIETNDGLALSSGNLTRFHSRTAPGISVIDYLNRLARHATLSPPLLLSMVYYIDRLCALYPEFTINTLTVHRFLITAATVAAKGLSDSFWNNATYAKVGGVRVAELKMLELEFLYRVDWKIVPNPSVLVAYYKGLVERCPGYVLEQSASSSPDDADGSGNSLANSSPLGSSDSLANTGN